MEPVLIDCIEPSPREPRAVGPVPPPATESPDRISDAAEASLDLTGDLIGFVRDVADWTETLDGHAWGHDDFADLEELGARAHDLNRRIREAMEL